jgi:Ulp1 family protease
VKLDTEIAMEIVDYAKPCMDAEKALKDAHDAFLENDYDRALTHTLEAIVNARLMYISLRVMKEQQ